MNKNHWLHYFNRFSFYLLIFLWTYTGVSKLIDHDIFESTLHQSPIIKEYSAIISWLVPIVEITLVMLLFSKKYFRLALFFSLLLLFVFTGYIVYLILFIPALPCLCGGVLKAISWNGHLLLNSFFIFSIVILLLSLPNHQFFIAINRQSRKPV